MPTAAEATAKPDGSAPRRAYSKRLPREERREQILDANLRVIVREGWAGATMERVAAEAEIAKSVLYSLFASQAGLQVALMRREQERAFAVAAAAIPAAPIQGDPIAALQRGLEIYLEGVETHPDTWRLVLIPASGTPASVRKAIEEGRERWRRELEPAIAELLERFGLTSLDAELLAHLGRGNAEYMARLVIEQPDRFSAGRLTDFTAQLAAAAFGLFAAASAQASAESPESD